MRIRKRDILPFLISFGILGVLLYNTDLQQVVETIQGADLVLLLAALVMTFSVMVSRVVRWKLFLDAYKLKIKPIDIASSFLASQFLANFTPARVGEASRPYFLKKRYKVSFFNLLPPVIVERFLDLITLLILSVLFLLFYSRFVSGILQAVLLLTFALLIALILVVLKKSVALKFVNLFFRLFSFIRAIRKMKPKISKMVSNFFLGVQTMKFARLGPIGFITLLSWIFESAILYFVVLALTGTYDFNFMYAVGFLCLAMLGGVVSSLPGGIGSVEAILFAFFLLIHFSAPLGLSVVLLYRFISFVISTGFFTIFFAREMKL